MTICKSPQNRLNAIQQIFNHKIMNKASKMRILTMYLNLCQWRKTNNRII